LAISLNNCSGTFNVVANTSNALVAPVIPELSNTYNLVVTWSNVVAKLVLSADYNFVINLSISDAAAV